MLVGDQLARSRSKSAQKVRTIWRNRRRRSLLRKEITVFWSLRLLCCAFCTSLTLQAVRRRVSTAWRRIRKVVPSIAASFLRAPSANCNSSMRCRNLSDNGCDTIGIGPPYWAHTESENGCGHVFEGIVRCNARASHDYHGFNAQRPPCRVAVLRLHGLAILDSDLFPSSVDTHESLHCVMLTRGEIHGKIGDVAAFNADHLLPIVIPQVRQCPCFMDP